MYTISTKSIIKRQAERTLSIDDVINGMWDCKTETQQELFKILKKKGFTLSNIFGAYQSKMFMTNAFRKLLYDLHDEVDRISNENKQLSRIAKKYAQTQRELAQNKSRQRDLLYEEEEGFLDLRKYRQAARKLDIYSKSWVTIVSLFFDENSTEYRLAQLLDERTKIRARAARIKRQLEQVGQGLLDKKSDKDC
ncbi:hypothetical protein FCL47_09980 [Desulfopila sp. IMCC35006]|uniref:hypothetical protein n=1 Tax=Desulfopila sp. IMCC35006 TaxID=2569542 RepID=UPI0010AC48E8|nr:hypothetical protein [Desulfopila sp. IMCC35006]TKB26070.1 hypothetical protein FCL47_09980 [Desulfopila sp. IMCC35006]